MLTRIRRLAENPAFQVFIVVATVGLGAWYWGTARGRGARALVELEVDGLKVVNPEVQPEGGICKVSWDYVNRNSKQFYPSDIEMDGDYGTAYCQLVAWATSQHGNDSEVLWEVVRAMMDGRTTVLWLRAGSPDTNDDTFTTLIDYLVSERGLNPDAKDDQGQTALHYALFLNGHPDQVILSALASVVDPNIGDADGDTPLHYAVAAFWRPAWGRMDISPIRALVEAGADVNRKNERGQTPMHLAVAMDACNDDNEEPGRSASAVIFLSHHGGDVNARDEEGATPLDYARRCGGDVLAALLEALGGKPGAPR